jgi:C_GCAxxG_C_C family probable redox protein
MTSIDTEARVARALELHKAGYNCAQCVACASADLVGLDEDQLFRLMEGFGGGMGGFNQTCGAISGGVAIFGAANSGGTGHPKTKGSTYKLSRQLVDQFRAANGSSLCSELKGLTGGPVLRSCDGCIEDGLRLTLGILESLEK